MPKRPRSALGEGNSSSSDEDAISTSHPTEPDMTYEQSIALETIALTDGETGEKPIGESVSTAVPVQSTPVDEIPGFMSPQSPDANPTVPSSSQAATGNLSPGSNTGASNLRFRIMLDNTNAQPEASRQSSGITQTYTTSPISIPSIASGSGHPTASDPPFRVRIAVRAPSSLLASYSDQATDPHGISYVSPPISMLTPRIQSGSANGVPNLQDQSQTWQPTPSTSLGTGGSSLQTFDPNIRIRVTVNPPTTLGSTPQRAVVIVTNPSSNFQSASTSGPPRHTWHIPQGTAPVVRNGESQSGPYSSGSSQGAENDDQPAIDSPPPLWEHFSASDSSIPSHVVSTDGQHFDSGFLPHQPGTMPVSTPSTSSGPSRPRDPRLARFTTDASGLAPIPSTSASLEPNFESVMETGDPTPSTSRAFDAGGPFTLNPNVGLRVTVNLPCYSEDSSDSNDAEVAAIMTGRTAPHRTFRIIPSEPQVPLANGAASAQNGSHISNGTTPNVADSANQYPADTSSIPCVLHPISNLPGTSQAYSTNTQPTVTDRFLQQNRSSIFPTPSTTSYSSAEPTPSTSSSLNVEAGSSSLTGEITPRNRVSFGGSSRFVYGSNVRIRIAMNMAGASSDDSSDDETPTQHLSSPASPPLEGTEQNPSGYGHMAPSESHSPIWALPGSSTSGPSGSRPSRRGQSIRITEPTSLTDSTGSLDTSAETSTSLQESSHQIESSPILGEPVEPSTSAGLGHLQSSSQSSSSHAFVVYRRGYVYSRRGYAQPQWTAQPSTSSDIAPQGQYENMGESSNNASESPSNAAHGAPSDGAVARGSAWRQFQRGRRFISRSPRGRGNRGSIGRGAGNEFPMNLANGGHFYGLNATSGEPEPSGYSADASSDSSDD